MVFGFGLLVSFPTAYFWSYESDQFQLKWRSHDPILAFQNLLSPLFAARQEAAKLKHRRRFAIGSAGEEDSMWWIDFRADIQKKANGKYLCNQGIGIIRKLNRGVGNQLERNKLMMISREKVLFWFGRVARFT